jgi:hypothetical protein
MATPCGRSHIHLVRALSAEMIWLLEQKHPSIVTSPPKRHILILQRTMQRINDGYDQLVTTVTNTYANVLPVQLFIDSHVPSLQDIGLLFYSAHIIIAPHGAGLGNMWFTKLHKRDSSIRKGSSTPYHDRPALIEIHHLALDPVLSFADMAEALSIRSTGLAYDTITSDDIDYIVGLVHQLF